MSSPDVQHALNGMKKEKRKIPDLKWNEFYILIDNELVDYKCTNINVHIFTTVSYFAKKRTTDQLK